MEKGTLGGLLDYTYTVQVWRQKQFWNVLDAFADNLKL